MPGGGDAGSLLPGVLPPELGASRNEPGQTRRCLQLFVPHTSPHVHTQPTHHTHHTTHQTTDRDLESVFVRRKENGWTRAQSTTDRDLDTKK